MDYTISIPEDFERKVELLLALHHALPFLDADSVYLTPLQGTDQEYLLTILICNNARRHNFIRDDVARMALAAIAGIHYQIWDVVKAENTLLSGNLFFIDLHANANPICFHENSIMLFYHRVHSLAYLKARATERSNYMLRRIEELVSNAQWCFEKQYCQLAAHVLHQIFHLLFRTSEELLIGRETMGEELIDRHKLLERYRPDLFKVFDAGSRRMQAFRGNYEGTTTAPTRKTFNSVAE